MKYIFSIILYLCFTNAKCQILMTHSFGVVGSAFNLSSNSNPILLSNTNCLKVNNGVSKMLESKKGDFVNECVVNLPYIQYNFQIGPNPFNDYTVIKLNQKVDNIIFKIIVLDEMGYLTKVVQVKSDQLYSSGYQLNFSEFKTGVFYLNISSNKFYQSYKITKL